MIPHVPIRRTFSTFTAENGIDEDAVDLYAEFALRTEQMTWAEILKKRFVVILGEAGLGKTAEFRHQAGELGLADKAAFFLPLNQLTSSEATNLATEPFASRLRGWRESNEPGYFFLDSVDEARLTSTTVLSHALRLVARHLLRPHGRRAHLFISSRISDWAIPAVRQAVEEALLEPLQTAANRAGTPGDASDDTVLRDPDEGAGGVSIEVVKLSALDEPSARSLAIAYGASPLEAFWQDVTDGGYVFMATRPLDLEWMVRRWTSARRLGTYTELIDNAIAERLEERNERRLEAGIALSPKQLRTGAEALAAASVFSNLPHVALLGEAAGATAINPRDVLTEWKPADVAQLLGAALFDEASFGQVRFHHRVVREYLAASWIAGRLNEGLPLAKVIPLFVQTAHGTPVLIQGRRSALCWLASMHAPAREYVIRNFPEMVMFEGDPDRWSEDDVVEAFDALLLKLAGGYRPNWYNDESELRRLARRIPTGVLCDRLTRFAQSPLALHRILSLIKHARAKACAPAVRALYGDVATSADDLPWYVEILGIIGTAEDRDAMANDLAAGRFKDAESIASAVAACGVARLPTEVLQKTLQSIEGPADEATSTAHHVNRSLLEEVTLADMLTLLETLEAILPAAAIESAKQDRGIGEKLDRRAWMLHALPDWVERAIALLPVTGASAPDIIVRLSMLVDRLRDTSYVNDHDLVRPRTLIAERAFLRRALAVEIMKADPAQIFAHFVVSPGLIAFGAADLPALLIEATRTDLPAGEQPLWLQLALDVAVFTTRGAVRRNALAQLAATGSGAADVVQKEKRGRIDGTRQRRNWRHEHYKRKKEERQGREKQRAELHECIAAIRDGTDQGRLTWLLRFALSEARSTRYAHPDVRLIRAAFDADIADAFLEGLRRVWRAVDLKSPRDYPDHETPWAAILGLAGANADLGRKEAMSAPLRADDITRLAQLSVWTREHDSWFSAVAGASPDIAFGAIKPWLEGELRDPAAPRQRVIEFSLSAPEPLKGRALAAAMDLIADGTIIDEPLRIRLLRAMQDQDAALRERAAKYVLAQLDTRHEAGSSTVPLNWFELLATLDLLAAVNWILAQLPAAEADRRALVAAEASLLESVTERGSTTSDEEVAALKQLFELIADHGGIAKSAEEEDGGAESPRRMVSILLQRLVATRGNAAHVALRNLAEKYASSPRGPWIAQRVLEHAAAEAEATSAHAPSELAALELQYCRDPETTKELFEQVHARLIDIKDGVENGPFSERLVLPAGIPEKHLQLWLGSRLSDTPFRRFNPRFQVHREPVVDDDNRTDIELSARPGKVCVEIKPLDRERSYSANSLADTIRTQLVGQYLRGRNSRHGILVIARLDDKEWQIPGKPGTQPFSELVTFLKQECQKVMADTPDIDELEIVAIDCVAPAK